MLTLTAASSGTTEDFLAAVRSSHVATVRVEVWSEEGNKLASIFPLDGSITTDARRAVRRSIELTIADHDGTLTPTTRTSILAPFAGNQIRVWRGIKYPNGTTAEVPQGVFRITNVDVTRSQSGLTLNVTGEDLAWNFARKPFVSVKSIADNTNINDALTTIAEDVYTGLTKNFTDTGFAVGSLKLGVDTDLDPWETCRQIALGAGHELYFDPNAVMTTSTIPVLSEEDADVAFLEDSEGVTIDLSRSLTAEDINNGVKLSAEGIGLFKRWSSSAYDTDPTSPTNVDDYGQKPVEFTTRVPRYIAADGAGTPSTEQTDMMAQALLQTVIGQPIDLEVIPNPMLDVRDVIRVQSGRLNLDTTAIIDTITMPLTSGGTSRIAARARTL